MSESEEIEKAKKAEKKAKKEREELERLERLKKAGYKEKASDPKCASCNVCRYQVKFFCTNPRVRSKISPQAVCKYFAPPIFKGLPEECKKL